MPDPTELTDSAAAAVPASPKVVEERPPPGPARGKFTWPAWGIATFGSVVVALGLFWIVWRLRRVRKS